MLKNKLRKTFKCFIPKPCCPYSLLKYYRYILKAVPKKENKIFIQNFKDHNMNLYYMLQ